MTKIYDSDTQVMKDILTNDLPAIKISLTSETENQIDIEGNSLLILSLYTMDIKTFEYVLNYYIENNPDIINATNSVGNTALMLSSRSSKTSINFDSIAAKMLIDAGAKLDIKNNYHSNFIDIYKRNYLYLDTWLNEYETQKKILTREPSIISDLIRNNIKIHPKIEIEFAHLITGNDLNLL